MKTKLIPFGAIGVASLLVVSCACPPENTFHDKPFTSFQHSFVVGQAGKKMTFVDAQGTEYFIQASDPIKSSSSGPSKIRGKVGMFSCDESIPIYTVYRQDISFTSTIEGFNWEKLSINTQSNDMASVVLLSKDSTKNSYNNWYKIKFYGSIENGNEHIKNSLFKENYWANNVRYTNVNVVVTDTTIPDSLFWNREQGFIKFTSRDKKQYFLKR